MSENRYAAAGWMAIINVGIVCTSAVLAIVFSVIIASLLHGSPPSLGPSNFLDLASTAIGIYLSLKLKDLLHERYNFYEIDGLIWGGIIWGIVTQICILGIGVIGIILGPGGRIFSFVLLMIFGVVAVVIIGIINIMAALKLMKIKEQISNPLRFYTYLCLTAGILQISIIFAFFSLFLLPVLFVNMAMIFLREEPQVEFV